MSEIVRKIVRVSDTEVVWHATQDCEPILALNKAWRNRDLPSSRLHYNGTERWYRVASIPNIVIEQWLQKGINFYDPAHWPKIKSLLNDPDYAYLKCTDARI